MTEKYTGTQILHPADVPKGLPAKKTKKTADRTKMPNAPLFGMSGYVDTTRSSGAGHVRDRLDPQEMYMELSPAPFDGIEKVTHPINMSVILLIILFISFVIMRK
jgi:hypothetical protein